MKTQAELFFSKDAPPNAQAAATSVIFPRRCTPHGIKLETTNRIEVYKREARDESYCWCKAIVLELSPNKTSIFVHYDTGRFAWVNLARSLRINVIDAEPPKTDLVFHNKSITYTIKAGTKTIEKSTGLISATPAAVASQTKPKTQGSKRSFSVSRVESGHRIKVLRQDGSEGYNATVLKVDLQKNEMLICYDGNIWSMESLDHIKFEIISKAAPSEVKDFYNPNTNIHYTLFPDSKYVLESSSLPSPEHTAKMLSSTANEPAAPATAEMSLDDDDLAAQQAELEQKLLNVKKLKMEKEQEEQAKQNRIREAIAELEARMRNEIPLMQRFVPQLQEFIDSTVGSVQSYQKLQASVGGHSLKHEAAKYPHLFSPQFADINNQHLKLQSGIRATLLDFVAGYKQFNSAAEPAQTAPPAAPTSPAPKSPRF